MQFGRPINGVLQVESVEHLWADIIGLFFVTDIIRLKTPLYIIII